MRREIRGDMNSSCELCGTVMSKAEGGEIFTICENCWAPPEPSKESLERAKDFLTKYGHIKSTISLAWELALELDKKVR